MQFLSPATLWALFALAVPILLHLFYFRRFRRVEFSNVRFLREVKEETQNRSRLRNLLVLALRLLAFAALILAFAQPYLPARDAAPRTEQPVAIFVDNSFSMSAQASDVALLDKAKQRAREIIRAYGLGDRFALLTNELTGASSRLLSREDALAAVDQIVLSPASREASTVLARAEQALGADGGPLYLISDFQRSQFDPDQLVRDSSLTQRLVPISAVSARNVSVDSVWLAHPVQLVGEPTELVVRLSNYGDEDADAVRLGVRANGRQQPFGTRAVAAGSSLTDTLRLASAEAGWTDAAVEITDFPVEYDDRYYVSFEVRRRLRALAIADGAGNAYLRSAFPADGPLALDEQRAGNVNYSSFADYDLIVLDDLTALSSGLVQALSAYASAGGKVLVFPAAGATAAGYDQLLAAAGLPSLGNYREGEQTVGELNRRAFVFQDVFERLPRNLRLPSVRGRYAIRAGNGERILSFRDGSPFVVGSALDDGIVYLAAAPLDPAASDLVRNGEIFVPMVYRMAFSGASARPSAYTLGSSQLATLVLPSTLGEAAVRLLGRNERSSIPVQRRLGDRLILSFDETPTEDGFYRVVGSDDSTFAHLAFNYDRRESPQEFLADADLEATGFPVFDGNVSGSLEQAIARTELGTPWWPYLVVLALVALLAEALVLRFWRPERRGRSPASTPAKGPASANNRRVSASTPVP